MANNTNVVQRGITYDAPEVQAILANVDGKFFIVTEFGASDFNGVGLPTDRLTTFRRRYNNSKSLLLIPDVWGNPNGYVPATVTSQGSSFSFYFVCNNTLYNVEGDSADNWTVTAQPLDVIAQHEEITVSELLATPITAATIAKLNAMRAKNAENILILIKNGQTLIPFNIEAYGSSFEGYFVYADNTGKTYSVMVGADPSGTTWTVTRTELVTKAYVDAAIAAAKEELLAAITQEQFNAVFSENSSSE